MARSTILLLLAFVVQGIAAQLPNTLTNAEKVYGLSQFWQEVNYNFIYLNKVDRDKWNADYLELITEVQETENDYQYYRLLQKFCATLKDGHTNVYMPKETEDLIFNTHFGKYRLFLGHIDGKTVITRTNLSKKDEIPAGTVITTVNGVPTQEYIDTEVKPYISSSTDYILDDLAAFNLLRGLEGTAYDIEMLLPNGKRKSMTLTHSRTTEKEVYPPYKQGDGLMSFEWMDTDLAYVSLNSFGDPKIDTLFIEKLPELYKAEKLIIDLRNNGGGNTRIGLEIMKYLTHDTLLYGSKAQSRLHIPSYKAWGNWVEAKDTVGDSWAKQSYLTHRDAYYHDFEYGADSITDDIRRLVVPTVLLIGHNTASAAEDFLIYADTQEHMTVVGEPTFGSTGQPMPISLPGGGSARICTKKDTYPDGREFVGLGIQPDIAVRKTLKDYLENRDPALIKALEFLRNGK